MEELTKINKWIAQNKRKLEIEFFKECKRMMPRDREERSKYIVLNWGKYHKFCKKRFLKK